MHHTFIEIGSTQKYERDSCSKSAKRESCARPVWESDPCSTTDFAL